MNIIKDCVKFQAQYFRLDIATALQLMIKNLIKINMQQLEVEGLSQQHKYL